MGTEGYRAGMAEIHATQTVQVSWREGKRGRGNMEVCVGTAAWLVLTLPRRRGGNMTNVTLPP